MTNCFSMVKPKPRIKKRKSRRKLGSRSYKNYTPEMLQLAVESVANNTITTREAEKQFGIPRRTIVNRLKHRHLKPVGKPTRLREEEENKLINVITASADYGSPLTKLDLRILVHNYLKKNGKDYIFNKKMPGEKWVNNFLSRHSEKLTVRSTQNISTSRAQKGEDEMLNYFKNLRDTLKDIPPANILNYDETNCSDDPGSSKAIFRRGVKYPERIINSTKGCVSLMFSGTADGKCLPPYVVYRADNLYNEWILNGPTDARYNCTRSGWFDAAMFEDYFRSVVLEWAKRLPGLKVVIGDNLSSHLSPEIVQLCEEHEIKFVFLPPNSTHLTQPLDIAFFGPLKKEWRKILLKYKIENPAQKTMNKKHFPTLLKTLLENIEFNQSKNLRSGFKAAGIYPLNPREVLKRIPELEFSDSMTYQIDDSLLDYLKQSRAPNPIKTVRNKKIYVEPGKSVSVTDFENKELFEKPGRKGKTKKDIDKPKPKLKKMKTDKIKLTTTDSKVKNDDKIIYNEIMDEITEEVTDDIQNTIDIDNLNIEEQELTAEINILNEKTGIMQTYIKTNVIIEIPKSTILKDNYLKDKLKSKTHNDIKKDSIEVCDSYIDSNSKENIENSSDSKTTSIYKPIKLKHKFNVDKVLTKKTKNKPAKRLKTLQSTSSTTTEEISMSEHSDSDLVDIDLDQTDDPGVMVDDSDDTHSLKLNDIDSIQEIFDEVDEVVKRKNDERETEIFNEILRIDLENDKNLKKYGHTEDIRGVELADKRMMNDKQIETENTTIFNIGDNVIVRYYLTKKWQYYVGEIIDVIKNVENKYKISYYKTISKKDHVKFKKPRRPDIDDIPHDLIIKQVDLLQINENNEFVLFDDDDSVVYF